MVKTIELMFFDAGGGHRSAANALREVARLEGRPWALPMTNVLELFPDIDPVRRLTGLNLADVYAAMIRRGWTLGTPLLMSVLKRVVHLSHQSQVARLVKHWDRDRPDLVVSLIPHLDRAMYEAVQRRMPEVPFVTILTDLADYPPHFWIEERQRQYFIVGSDRAREQALAAGHPVERVFQTSGMIIHPRFYEAVAGDRAREFAELGLDPARPTAMMMFGGEGATAMLTIARRLDASGLDVQIIAVCGRNERLVASMRAMPRRIPMHVTGFTSDVARLMRLSTFFIGKAGPGSISEAAAMGLPVIIERNHWTLPQERYNADFVEERGLGLSVRSFRRDIVTAAATMLDPARRRQFTERVGAYTNRAVFEIPVILERLLSG
jgi:UDP-N-acetylglucosamine:LPS N-acetylglucosamine transferase